MLGCHLVTIPGSLRLPLIENFPAPQPLAHFYSDTSQPAFAGPLEIFINQLRNEHFELLHGDTVSQELSSGTIAVFIRTAMLPQLFESLYYILPLRLYKNKWGKWKNESTSV